jgi:hypothetical protein
MRYVMRFVAVALAAFMFYAIGSAPQASAAVDIPGVDLCDKGTPYAATPTEGIVGATSERPITIARGASESDPNHVWAAGGFAGLSSTTYDLGCGMDPTTWSSRVSSGTDTSISNFIVSIGQSMTSLSNSLDRRAWQPDWITTLMSGFADRSAFTIQARIWAPWMAVAFAFTAGLIAWRNYHDGNVSGAARSSGWTMFVVVVSCAILSSPLWLSMTVAQAGGFAAATIHGGTNGSDAATESIVTSVHYQGWLRRTFGSDSPDTAKRYGMELLNSSRITWSELDAINSIKDDKERSKARQALDNKKRERFEKVTDEIKNGEYKDALAYRNITGSRERIGSALLETVAACSAGVYRIVVALLMILCAIVMVVLAILWLVSTVWIISPRGEDLGREMIKSATLCLRAVVLSVFASWLFDAYLYGALQPNTPFWWSVVLILLGTVIAWSLLRPDRKALEILTLGKVRGYGQTGRWLMTLGASYLGGRVAGAAAAKALQPKPAAAQPSAPTIAHPLPPVGTAYATVTVPPRPTYISGAVAASPSAPLALGGGVYQRRPDSGAATYAPPPDASSGYGEPYQRIDSDSDDMDGARS